MEILIVVKLSMCENKELRINIINMNKKDLVNKGFISLIEWENKYEDRLMIFSPSKCYRKNNIIARMLDENNIKFYKIFKVNMNSLGYRIPELIEIKNYEE